MRILLFIDSNIKTIPYEVPLLSLMKRGYSIAFLSILKEGPIHDEYRKYGIDVFSMGEERISIKRLPKYLLQYLKICQRGKINVVFAHLAIPSMISVLMQFFGAPKVVCFRHHFNFTDLVNSPKIKENKIDKIIDRINARLASKIILPSFYLKEMIHKSENIPLEKMSVIPYAYNWDNFIGKVSLISVPDNSRSLKLLMISRLTKLKRPELALDVVAALSKRNVEVNLTILGAGDLEDILKEYAKVLVISNLVRFVGFQSNVTPFIVECDALIHPSLTEASSSVIKEAGVLGRPVIVCNGVGDFNDYIQDGINGWRVDPNRFIEETTNILSVTSREMLHKKGSELRKTILSRFSLTESVVDSYASLVS